MLLYIVPCCSVAHAILYYTLLYITHAVLYHPHCTEWPLSTLYFPTLLYIIPQCSIFPHTHTALYHLTLHYINPHTLSGSHTYNCKVQHESVCALTLTGKKERKSDCGEWQWSVCVANEGDCGLGTREGTRTRTDCKQTIKTQRCKIPCNWKKQFGGEKPHKHRLHTHTGLRVNKPALWSNKMKILTEFCPQKWHDCSESQKQAARIYHHVCVCVCVCVWERERAYATFPRDL